MKKITFHFFAIFVTSFLCCKVSRAQCPPNINFEFGNLTNWECWKGTVAQGTGTCPACTPSVPTWNPNSPITPVSNRHQIMTGSGLDPYFLLPPSVNCPVVCPYISGNSFSVKLGNDNVLDSCERLRYYINIPVGLNYYSFTYWYAVVLENPGWGLHTYAQMPRFQVSAYDAATGNPIGCTTSNFVVGTTLPGFTEHYDATRGDSIICKNWSAANLNFKNLGGHTVVVEFFTADCTPSAHFGYAYVDFSDCASTSIRLANCSTSNCDTLIAPPGFQNYVWYDSTLTNILGTGDSLILCPAPTSRDSIKLAFFPYPGFGCPDTIAVAIYPPVPPVANFIFHDSLCPGFPFQFYDSSYTTSPGQYISNWMWNFGDPYAIASNPNTSNLQNPTHVYDSVGVYQVTLIAQTNAHCKSDTTIKTIHILNKNHVFASKDDTICLGSTVILTATGTGPIPPPIIPCALNTTGGCSGSTSTVQVGIGTNISNTFSPFNFVNSNGRTMMRYSAASLTAALGAGAKVLTAIQFNVTTKQSGGFPFAGLTVKLSCIPSSTIYWNSGTVNYPTYTNNIVYGPTNFVTVAGWNTITFATPYNWDGTSDLIVDMCYSSLLFANIDIVQKTVTANNTVIYGGNTSSPAGCNIVSGTVSNLLPNIKFAYCTIPFISGYNYQWTASTPNAFTGTPFNDSLTAMPYSTTTYTVNMIGTTPCIVTDQVIVHTIANFASNHSPNSMVCKGDTIGLFDDSNSSAVVIAKWKWRSLRNNPISCDTCRRPIFTIQQKDTLVVKISMASGCSRFDSIIVDTFPKIAANFLMSRYSICSGDTAVAHFTGTTNATGAVTYHWNFNNPIKIGWGANHDFDTVAWLNNGIAPLVKNISLSISQNGCNSDTVTKQVTIHIIPKAHITATDTQFCAGSLVSVSAQGSTIENPATATYTWYSSPLTSTPPVITGPGPNQISFSFSNIQTANVYEYLQITENGCTSPWDSTLLVVHPIPFSNFNSTPNPVCTGKRVFFDFTGVIDSAYTNSHTITWNFSNGNPSTYTSTIDTTSAIFYNNGTSSISDLVSVTVTHNNCQSPPYTFSVIVNPNPQPIIVGPRDICLNQTSVLTTQVPYAVYNWVDGNGTVTHHDSLKVTVPETVSVNVVDYNGCVGNSSTTAINVHPLPHADAGSWQSIFLGNSAILDGSNSYGGDTYYWSPANSITNPNLMQATATPSITTVYQLAYSIAATGCVDYDTVTIDVKDCKPLIIPNAFTPNGDGIDDYFMILNPNDYYRLVSFQIFDRWGQMVYSTNNKNGLGWDGNYLGNPQPIADYFFSIVAECGGGRLIKLKGDVTLLR